MSASPVPPYHPVDPLASHREVLSAMWQELATHDQLTDLSNKSSWQLDVEQRIQEGNPFGSIFIDLDSFKLVNDTLTHKRGDQLLQDFGNHLEHSFSRNTDLVSYVDGQVPGNSLVARWAGDEFAITFDITDNHRRGVEQDPEHPEHPKRKTLQQRMDDEMNFFKTVVGEFVDSLPKEIKDLGVDVSYGSVLWDPKYPKTTEEFFDELDALMYKHKEARRQAEHDALPRRKRLAAWAASKLTEYSDIKPKR